MLEKTLESPSDSKIKPTNSKGNQWTLNIHWKDWCWSSSSNTLATWYEEQTHWRRPWCWERLKAEEEEGEEDEMVELMASSTQWAWIWANSRRQWRIGKPGMLQSMGSQNQTQLSDWTTTLKRCRRRGWKWDPSGKEQRQSPLPHVPATWPPCTSSYL